jgi:hypothetical protein
MSLQKGENLTFTWTGAPSHNDIPLFAQVKYRFDAEEQIDGLRNRAVWAKRDDKQVALDLYKKSYEKGRCTRIIN